MGNLSFDELIIEYKVCAKTHHETDYGNKKSVIMANKAVKRMIEISKTINNVYASRIYDFAEMLNCKEFKIDIWVAHHILENMNYPPILESKALHVIINCSKEDSVDGLGNRMWLEQWNNKNNKTFQDGL